MLKLDLAQVVRTAPRSEPLARELALARGPAALALGRRLLFEPSLLDSLLGLVGDTRGDRSPTPEDEFHAAPRIDTALLLLRALHPERSADCLPWVDGVEYFARDLDAQELWVPTHLTQTPPSAVVAGALADALLLPACWLPSEGLLIPMSQLQRIGARPLASWLAAFAPKPDRVETDD